MLLLQIGLYFVRKIDNNTLLMVYLVLSIAQITYGKCVTLSTSVQINVTKEEYVLKINVFVKKDFLVKPVRIDVMDLGSVISVYHSVP